MRKRRAETELTKESCLDGEDDNLCLNEATEGANLRSREEVLKLGKPIIRLRKSSANGEFRRSTPPVTTPADQPVEAKEKTSITTTPGEESPKPVSGAEISQTDISPTGAEKEVEVACKKSKLENSDAKTREVVQQQGNDTRVVSPGPASSPGSIFGTLFSQPFTNPFAEAAKSGDASFSSSSGQSTPLLSVPQLFETPSIFSIPISSTSTTTSEGDSDSKTDEGGAHGSTPATAASTPRPAQFPGEEDETEIFADANVVLLKCVPVQSDSSSDGAESTPVKPHMKFKKQGEGVLKLLTPRDASSSDKENAECKKRRLVVRQKGTWTILLNSPLWLSKKFDLVPQMSSGHGVRFVGLDQAKVLSTADLNAVQHVPLAAYCIRFDTEVKRQEFLLATSRSTTQ